MDNSSVKSPTLWNRVKRALAGCIPGVILGLICHAVGYGDWWALIVGALGMFIGGALAQPDVSTTNVLSATAGVIVAYNLPIDMEQDNLDEEIPDSPEPEEPGDPEDHPEVRDVD